MTDGSRIGIDQPAGYLLKIQGRLPSDLRDWFLDPPQRALETSPGGPVITCLTGMVADQAALHGLLNQIRDLGLVLLYLECLSAAAEPRKIGPSGKKP